MAIITDSKAVSGGY